MQRGEIWNVDFEPVRGSEANKIRPAVIVSNNSANRVVQRLGRGTITVVPLTTNIARVLPFQVLLPAGRTGLRHDSKAQAEQIRALSIDRFGARLGAVTTSVMDELEQAIRVQLDL